MRSALKPRHLRRYREIVSLIVRYGRSDLLEGSGLDGVPDDPGNPAEAIELTADLERLGPTFVKLGQLLSTRADLLPRPYLDALSRLQDDVAPIPLDQVERVVADELGSLSRIFGDFDPEPLAAASLAQVHRAWLRTGRPVAVKVQRPGIHDTITTDLEVLGELAGFLERHTEAGSHYRLSAIHAEFRRSLLRELDFQLEARNLETLRHNLRDFRRIVVPRPANEFTTSRVLTMDFVEGRKINEAGESTLLEVDGVGLAEEFLRAYLQQILSDGFFHADPHPGNVLLTTDDRLALIDLGMTSRLTSRMQDRIIRLLVALGDGDAEEVTNASIALGEPRPDFDREGFAGDVTDLVGQVHGAGMSELEFGSIVLEVARTSAEQGLRPAPELSLLGKTLLNIDEVVRTLDIDVDPNRLIRDNIPDVLGRRFARRLSPGSLVHSALEGKEFVEELPGRINRIMDTLADGRLEVKIDAVDAEEMIRVAQKIANRVTAGLVLAAIIVGASLVMQLDVEPTLFGYPAIAIVLFLSAAAAGGVLVLNILFSDRRGRGRG